LKGYRPTIADVWAFSMLMGDPEAVQMDVHPVAMTIHALG